MNFTVDCNPQYNSVKFRIRAIGTRGVTTIPLTVNIAITSRNFNSGFAALNNWGNDTSVTKFLPMTNDWDLYVGALTSLDGASLAIKALQNGNVGIGTATPKEKLSVNGKIRAHEVKVETANWPDYVFQPGYDLLPLLEIEKQVKATGHLPDMPSAREVENNGLELGEMNKLLLKKIEELTLHLIELKKENNLQQQQLEQVNKNYKVILKVNGKH
ncbi:hypothetical protein [Pedobacter rhizosphaerae]|uniref:Uncharacterized protein n=1 Tax=Pedobacter rhizosphaerae TaxID=390241 RepID=A0A1H9VF21_9SPHI|nr:hypothetical protein [Pedobacter rhizosphaerae]SES20151.1 hypothetical protein SAMN04488023_14212 [Pedobacter rhizosphaerae]